MKSLVTPEEAGRLWGCTPRHILHLSKRGVLRVWDYRIVHHQLDEYRMMVVRRPLFAAAEVLQARVSAKASKSERAKRFNERHKDRIRASVSKASNKMARVWKSMPSTEKAKWGRRWRRGVTKWLQRGRNAAMA